MPRRKKKQTKPIVTEEITSEENIEDIPLIGISKDTCVIKSSPLVGRFMVAKKRLREGEIILKEQSLVVGPCQDTATVCIGCCLLLKTDIKSAHRCGGCGWPICGGGCPGINGDRGLRNGGHVKAECNILKTYRQPLTPSCYNVILPLRCLLLQSEDPAAWSHIMRMESHDEIRRNIPQIWNKNELTVVQPIRQMNPEYSDELIHTVCGKLEVNCFSVGEDDVEARALYSTAYLIQHDCTPNTTHVDSLGFEMTLRASRNIEPNDPITLTYASSLHGTLRRRREIKESKFFDCICARCSSDTELGTYMSAVKCYHCNDGWLLPHRPLENQSQWVCSTCKKFVDRRHPVIITEKSSADFEALKDCTISEYENLMMKYVDLLHPHHSTMTRIKLALSQMYGKTQGYLLGQMSPEMLKRKYDICNDLFSVLDVIEPGMTRLRGITMYECHAPLLMLTQISASTGLINQKELKRELTKVRDLLTKSVAILSFEEPGTSVGHLYKVAKDALSQTKNWPI